MIETSSIFLCYNRLDLTKWSLEALFKYTTFDEKNILTIIDNNSTDGTREWLVKQNWPYVDLILNKNETGAVKAVNQGMRRVHAKYYILLQNDMRVIPHWRDYLLTAANMDERIGIVGLDQEEIVKGRDGATGNEGVYDVPFVGTVCTLIKDEMVKDIGYFDEDFDYHDCDDVEYCYRARIYGWRVVWVTWAFIKDHLRAATNRWGVNPKWRPGQKIWLEKKARWDRLLAEGKIKGRWRP